MYVHQITTLYISNIYNWFCQLFFNKIKRKKVKSLSCASLFATPWTAACTKLLRSWDFLGKNTGVGCRFLLQGIFTTQGSNPGLPHCRQTFYHLNHQASYTWLGENMESFIAFCFQNVTLVIKFPYLTYTCTCMLQNIQKISEDNCVW